MGGRGLKAQLEALWPRIKVQLLSGEYQSQSVRADDIPKPDGGTRTLDIPMVWCFPCCSIGHCLQPHQVAVVEVRLQITKLRFTGEK